MRLCQANLLDNFWILKKVFERRNDWPTSRATQFEQQIEINQAWWTLSHLSDTCSSLFKKSKNKMNGSV